MAEALGMECVHIGGYQLGAHYVTSEPLLTLTELATTTRYVTSAVKIKRVITNLRTKGVTGLDREQMIVWRKEVEDLIGLEEYYQIESETVER